VSNFECWFLHRNEKQNLSWKEDVEERQLQAIRNRAESNCGRGGYIEFDNIRTTREGNGTSGSNLTDCTGVLNSVLLFCKLFYDKCCQFCTFLVC
jgi:hypothetical protein